MNETPNTPPIIPPTPPPVPPASAAPDPTHLPLGKHPDDVVPIPNLIAAIEAILRQPRRIMFQLGREKSGTLIAALLVIAIFCSVIYGFIVGTFSGGDQLWAAPVKIAAGLMISALICLPSLYIFSCLSGSQARLVEVFGLLAGLLALTTVLLIGFAPVAWVFSQSTESLVAMGTLHLIFWLLSTYFGLRFLCRGFRHLKGTSNGVLVVWIGIFMLVAMQMTTALRPIVGTAPAFLPTEKKFFLSHWADCLKIDESSKRDRY
jgi:hypothetical protein